MIDGSKKCNRLHERNRVCVLLIGATVLILSRNNTEMPYSKFNAARSYRTKSLISHTCTSYD